MQTDTKALLITHGKALRAAPIDSMRRWEKRVFDRNVYSERIHTRDLHISCYQQSNLIECRHC